MGSMKLVRTFSTRLEADVATIASQAEGIDAKVIGVGVDMEGGADGVGLLVRDDRADAAREVLSRHHHTPEDERRIRDLALDHTIEESFPASDPPSSIPNPDDHDALETWAYNKHGR